MIKYVSVFAVLLIFSALVAIIHIGVADSTDYIRFSSGVVIFSPLNRTYNSRFLTLNLTFGVGLGVESSLNYSIDGKYEGLINLVAKNPTEIHVINEVTGYVTLPELSEGSHQLTVNVLSGIYDYHGANPPGAPFKQTSPDSSDYVASWAHKIYFTVDTKSESNWVEVIRFTGGSGITTTEPFTCDYAEWRIRWEYELRTENPEDPPGLEVCVYTQEYHSPYFEHLNNWGPEETNGTLIIHDKNGTFHLAIICGVPSYSVIIEQNLDSIPEFPSWAPLMIMLFTLLAVTLICRSGLRKNRVLV